MVDISEYLNIYVNIPVIKGNIKYYEAKEKYNLIIPLKEGEYEKIYVKQDFIKNIVPPLASGSKIGTVTAYIENEIIFKQDIYLNKNIIKNNILYYLNSALKDMFLSFKVI